MIEQIINSDFVHALIIFIMFSPVLYAFMVQAEEEMEAAFDEEEMEEEEWK